VNTLALLALLVATDAAALKRPSKDFLICGRRVECEKIPSLSAPRNALLLNFQDADFTGPYAWIKNEKPAVIRSVNQLLSHYGFAITAREIDEGEYAALREHPDADVILKYRANSFLATIGDTGVGASRAAASLRAVDKDGDAYQVLGPTRHDKFEVQDSDIEHIEVRPVGELANLETSPRRKRAMLAAVIVHEFVHAAQHRAMGTVVSGPPAAAMSPACVVPYKDAVKITDKFFSMLAYSRVNGHMTAGLMVAGMDHSGGLNDEYGGGVHSLNPCLEDAGVPSALFDDMAKLAEYGGLCRPKLVSDPNDRGYPVSDYFRLPETNRSFIASYIKKMSAIQCYGGCYYQVVDEATALKRTGTSPTGPYPAEIGLPSPSGAGAPGWWNAVNRQCAAGDRRTASR
jgi:hypothetical protein